MTDHILLIIILIVVVINLFFGWRR